MSLKQTLPDSPTTSAIDQTKYLKHATPGLSNKGYHASKGISASGLKLLDSSSPQKFRYSKDNPSEPTEAMAIGAAFHAMMEGPEKYAKEYAVAPTVDRRTKAGKEAWACFLKDYAGKEIITEKHHIHVIDMFDAVRADKTARDLMDNQLYAEHSIYWVDKETGVLCKCRPDAFFTTRENKVICLDYKTVADASPDGFSKACFNFGYDIQAAFYSEGIRQATGLEVQAFIFICVEKTPPYAVACYMVDDLMLEHGKMRYRRALNTYAQCEKENNWPGYSEKLEVISLPAWATKSLDTWEG